MGPGIGVPAPLPVAFLRPGSTPVTVDPRPGTRFNGLNAAFMSFQPALGSTAFMHYGLLLARLA